MLLDDMNLQFNLCNILAGFCGVKRELNLGNLNLQGLNFISISIVEIMYFCLLYRLITDCIPFRSIGAWRFGNFSMVLNFTRCPRVTRNGIFLEKIRSDVMYNLIFLSKN